MQIEAQRVIQRDPQGIDGGKIADVPRLSGQIEGVQAGLLFAVVLPPAEIAGAVIGLVLNYVQTALVLNPW